MAIPPSTKPLGILAINVMKILLIHTPTLEIDNFVPPLDILYLASMLKKEDCEVKIVDKDPEYFGIVSEVKSFNPDMIGLSFMTTAYKKFHKLCKVLKKEKIKLIWTCQVRINTVSDEVLKEIKDYFLYGLNKYSYGS